MPTRRQFLAVGAVAATHAATGSGFSQTAGESLGGKRPAEAKRKFVSAAVEAKIVEVKRAIGDESLAALFENCFPNTLDTTVRHTELNGKPDTFVITGDIDAMWLRDSTAQVWPYLRLATRDTKLKAMIAGVVNRQARSVLIDPYANAFNFGPTGSEWASDKTAMKPELHERKWEIDSLCYTVRLAHGYWKTTGDASCFDDTWRLAAALIVKTFREQQRMDSPGPYTFQRRTTVPSDTLPLAGYGSPTRPCGLIHSGFRPSDDACLYPFLIPSNLFAVASLRQLAEIHATVLSDAASARQASAFADEVEAAVERYGKARHARFGEVYAYEVDGFGNQVFMDDANIPSLLALPYLGCAAAGDGVYQSTRRLVLSDSNPYLFKGLAGEGIGGPHVGLDMIWPLGIIMRALTSEDESEIALCLKMLKTTTAGTGFMHESFHKDDPKHFTRAWFAWANTLFGELVLRVYEQHRKLL